jgi:hypothetical protein
MSADYPGLGFIDGSIVPLNPLANALCAAEKPNEKARGSLRSKNSSSATFRTQGSLTIDFPYVIYILMDGR